MLYHESVSCSVVSSPLWPRGLLCPWNSPGKNSGEGGHSLLQGLFPTQGLNPSLMHGRHLLYHLSQQGNPCIFTHKLSFSTACFAHSSFLLNSYLPRDPWGARVSEGVRHQAVELKKRRGNFQIWGVLRTSILKHAVLLVEINLFLLTGSAASKLTETGAFSASLHEAKRPSFQSQGYADCRSCFCQLITGVLSFRCCLSWHAELSKGPRWKWGYVCPSSVIHPPGEFEGSAVMVQWTLPYSCAGLFWGFVGRLTGLLWYPS